MRRFWAIRRIDRDYVEPTLYKSEAAARSAAASRRGYDVLELVSEAEARSEQPASSAWDWLASRRNLELDWGTDDEEDDCAWRVHRCSGNVNDREWELIATGSTPLAAVQAAREALHTPPKAEGEQ